MECSLLLFHTSSQLKVSPLVSPPPLEILRWHRTLRARPPSRPSPHALGRTWSFAIPCLALVLEDQNTHLLSLRFVKHGYTVKNPVQRMHLTMCCASPNDMPGTVFQDTLFHDSVISKKYSAEFLQSGTGRGCEQVREMRRIRPEVMRENGISHRHTAHRKDEGETLAKKFREKFYLIGVLYHQIH